MERIRSDGKTTIQKFDNKIKNFKNKIDVSKRDKKQFSIPLYYLQILICKYILKPLQIKKIKISEMEQKKILLQWVESPINIFNEMQRVLITKIQDFNEIKKSPYYSGAYGELKALKELSKL